MTKMATGRLLSGLSLFHVLIIATACGRIGYDEGVNPGADGGFDPGADGGFDPDAAINEPDAAPQIVCTPAELAIGILADYRFNDDAAMDETGNHHGTIQGASVQSVDEGPCASALAFTSPNTYIRIDDSPTWELESGSIDLWVRIPENNEVIGLVSKDAANSAEPGHFSLIQSTDGRIAVRGQTTTTSSMVCSDAPVTAESWIHIGVNFGSPGNQLWIDGVPQNGTGSVFVSDGGLAPCVGVLGLPIAGNSNPWVVGASAIVSADGSAEPADGYLEGGAMAQFRIGSVRRDFSLIR